MSGGLIQLVAYGAQDVYLTGNPQITFWKVVYRRHTNFSIECIELPINNADFGKRAYVTITRNGDLMTKVYLKAVLPSISYNGSNSECVKFAWCRRVGHALIYDVNIEIGGSEIDKQYGDWFTIWYELARNIGQDRGYAKMIGDVPELTELQTIQEPTNNGQVIKDDYTVYVPMQFWFCRNNGLALPLIALQYHEVRLNFNFRPFEQCVVYSSNVSDPRLFNRGTTGVAISMNCSVLVDYIYLDSEERRRFAQVGHEYLIEQLQFNQPVAVNTANSSTQLFFNHPVKALMWGLKIGYYRGGKFLAYSHTSDWSQAINDAASAIAIGRVWFREDCAVPYQINTGTITPTWTTILTDPSMNTTAWQFGIDLNGTALAAGASNATIVISDGSTATSDTIFSGLFGGGAAAGCSINVPVRVPMWNGAAEDAALLQCGNGPDYGSLVSVCGYTLIPRHKPDGSVDKVQAGAPFTIGVTTYPATTLVNSYRVLPLLGDVRLTIKHLSLPINNFTDNRSTYAQGQDVTVWQHDNFGLLINGTVNPVLFGNLKLNGQDRFDVRDGNYFNYVQPWQHWETTPEDGINTYSFSLKAPEHQPQGACNFSRIDTAQLNMWFDGRNSSNKKTLPYSRSDFIGSTNQCALTNTHELYIFALSYNVLRIMSGINENFIFSCAQQETSLLVLNFTSGGKVCKNSGWSCLQDCLYNFLVRL